MPDKSLKALVQLPLTDLRYGLSRKLNKVGKWDWSNPVNIKELEHLMEVLEEANLDPGQRVDLQACTRQVELTLNDPTRLPEELQKLIHLLSEFKLTGNLKEEELIVINEYCFEWQSSIFSEWELRKFIDELRHSSRDRRIEAEIQNVKAAMKTGRAPYKVDLETPARQLLWGTHLLYLICNPQKMDDWPRNRSKRNLAKSSIWDEVMRSHHVQYLRALFGAHIFNLLRDNDILVGWGEPGSWFAFFLHPKPGRISLDLLYSLMVGFDHARACAVHEISHAVQSKGVTNGIRERQIRMQEIDNRMQMGLADPGEPEQLTRLEQEVTLRKHFLNAAEDNCINHFTVQVGKLFGQDYGYSLNYFYTTMGDVGRRYSGDEDPYPEATGENRFANLTYIISRVFLAHNGLFENTPEAWREIKARPEWITARSRFNIEETLNPEASFNQLMDMCEEVEQLYPPLKEMAAGPEHYEDQAREFSKYRFALIDQMWDLYCADLCEEILDNSIEEESEDPFEKFNKKLEQEQPPQQPPPEVNEDNPTPPSSSDDESSSSDEDQDPSEPPPDQEGDVDSDEAPTDPEGDDEQPEDSGETSDQGDPSKGEPEPTPPPPQEQEEEEEDDPDDEEEDEEEGYAPPPPEEEAKEEEEAEEDIHHMDEPPPETEEEEQEQQQEVAIDESPPEEAAAQDEGDDADSAGDEGDTSEQEDEMDGGDEGEMEMEEWEPEEMPEEQLVAEEVEAPDIEHPEDREDDDDPREMPNEDGSGQGGDGSKHDVLQSDFFPDQPMASLRELRDALREAQKPQEEKRDRQRERPRRPDGHEHQKMEVPQALTLDQLAQGSWEDFAKRVAMHATIIALMAQALEKLKKAQLKLIYKVSRKHSLTPQGGDLRRYDPKATQKLFTKLATNEKFDRDDLNLFFRDKKIAAITRPTRVILIDGSRSMSMGSSPYPMDKAIQEAIIDYKASEIAGYDTYITMFGPDHPLVLARPGDNPTVIGKNIEKVRGGLNTMTQVAPGLLKTIEMVAHRKKFPEPYVGFTNFVFYSDGDVDDPRATQILIEKIFQYAPKSTFDFVLITEKQMTPMDHLVNRLRYNNPLHKIGVVKGDAARKYPMALMATYKLTNRLRSLSSGFADPAFVRSAQFRRLLRHLTT